VIQKDTLMADTAFLVRDDYQNRGIGTLLLQYLEGIARREGLHGFAAMVLRENEAMLRLFDNGGFDLKKSLAGGIFHLSMLFRESGAQ
jgi:GNAT superfamily N-acetyltransferase